MQTKFSVLKHRWILGIFAVIFVLPFAFGPIGIREAAAQCVVRTDWPTYTVVRGDTLFKIGQRFGTNSSVLATANCLTDVNRIFAGQQLRVPPGGVVITPAPLPPPNSTVYNVMVQFQRFENGFMFWRQDNGEISVYVGQAAGYTTSFPAYRYGYLPDNPVPDAVPGGLYRPAFGIGKVWGNFVEIRRGLGWATTPEISYLIMVTRSGNAFSFNIPDGRTIYVDGLRNWTTGGIVPPPPPPPPTVTPQPSGPVITTTAASYELFEGGFMIWEGRTGNIVVFYNSVGTPNPSYTVYTPGQYGNLAEYPDWVNVPMDRYRPSMGMGKVWSNFREVRNNLGWGLTPEQGFTATFISRSYASQSETCFTLPDGRAVNYVRSNAGARYWLFSGVCQ